MHISSHLSFLEDSRPTQEVALHDGYSALSLGAVALDGSLP